jgi:exodeoxyribonuclease V alpha subunit
MEETLYGVVTKVTYYSEETHFGVVRIKLDYKDLEIAKYKAKLFSNLLTVTCNFDRRPVIDEEYDFTGNFVTNQYGTQFKAKSFFRKNENTLEGVIAYLSSDLFPGIGKVAASRVFETFGKDCLVLIERNPEVLEDVVGLNQKQKETLKTNIVGLEHNKRLLVNILDLGITMKTALKLIKVFGDNADEIIKENPYKLIDFVEGFGFKRADRIALALGVQKDSEIRIFALTAYILKESCFSSGNVYLEYDELFQKICNEINVDEEIFFLPDFEKVLKKLIVDKKIILDEEKNIYLYQLYLSENILAQKVREFLNRENNNGYNINDINKIIKKVSEKDEIDYTEKQRSAIISALQEPLLIITGGPGTGKSTIIKAIINCTLELSPSELIAEKLALLAPTGRAAKRLNEICSFPAQTIHRFLGYEGQGIFKLGPEAKTDAKIVIIDEFSMVDVRLAARLFSSLEPDVKVIIVGDVDQLPSVEPGEVLADLIASKEIKTVRLDRIHRQSSESTIISLAHSVNQGIIEENLLQKQNDRNFIRVQDNSIVAGILKTVEQAMASGMDLIKDIQILVPLYKGEIGINAINEKMQETFNPGDGNEIKHLNRIFRVNDKVIQLVNRSEKKVMNGDIGHIISLNMEDGEYHGITVMFDFGPVDYDREELEDLIHAYAISIHKSQGSEYDLVIMPFSYKYYIMLRRKLVYTGITRAKKFLIMLGNLEAFTRGISGLEIKRKTRLAEKIKDNFNFSLDYEDVKNDFMENLSPYDFLD